MGSKAEGIRLYLTKKRCDETPSDSVTMRTNLLPSNSLTHANGGMASNGSESVSSLKTY